jgi:hypothetical protein
MTKKFLGKTDILEAPDAHTEEVEVPEWGGWVLVKALSGSERDRFEASVMSQNGKGAKRNLENIRAKLVVTACVDHKGKTIFSPADIKALGDKNAAALDRVFTVAQRLAGLSASDVDELAENFTEGRNGNSISS